MKSVANALRSEGDPRIVSTGPNVQTTGDKLARALGWFSIGLGLAELVAARKLARTFGLQGSEGMVRAFGVREIGAGIATLSTEKSLGLSSRVVGDVLDLLALGTALDAPQRRQRRNAALAFLSVGAIAALDVMTARMVARERARTGKPRDFGRRSGFPNGRPASSPRVQAHTALAR